MINGTSECLGCKREFSWKRHNTQKPARFCCKECWYEDNAKTLASYNDKRFNWLKASDEEKKKWLKSQYESKVVKKEGCWAWNGIVDKDGYGQMNISSNRQSKAHRVAWTLYKGEIPKGMRICHTCDNPPCTNLEHLFLGTPKENSQDMAKKGRSTKGEKNNTSKLKDNDVTKIKELIRMGVMLRRIAKDFNVSETCIWSIKSGRTWDHIK